MLVVAFGAAAVGIGVGVYLSRPSSRNQSSAQTEIQTADQKKSSRIKNALRIKR